MPEARRPRRPARSATNPHGHHLDPRHGDLPALMGSDDGTMGAWRARLQAATLDYKDISNTLRSSVASLEEQFGPAFAADLEAHLWPGKTPGHSKINYGHAFRPKGFYRSTFKPACTAAGLDGLHFHELRHTFATLALESGLLTMYELSVAMGHESEAVTNKVYAHLRKRDHTARRAAFSAFLAESATPLAPLRQIGG